MKQWLRKTLREFLYPADESKCVNSLVRVDAESNRLDADPTLHFKIYNAIGGKIVEFRRYDKHRDQADHQMYIIGKEDDFGDRIAKIATLEVLKG